MTYLSCTSRKGSSAIIVRRQTVSPFLSAILIGLLLNVAPALTRSAHAATVAEQFTIAVDSLAAQLSQVKGTLQRLGRGGKTASILITEKQKVPAGYELIISRLGPVQFHPVTKQRLGRFEDLLGVASVTQSLPQLAQVRLYLAPGAKASAGNRVTAPSKITVLLRPMHNLSRKFLNEQSFNSLLALAFENHPRFTVRSMTENEEPSQGAALEALNLSREYQVLVQPSVRSHGDGLMAEIRVTSVFSQRTLTLTSLRVALDELTIAAAPLPAQGSAAMAPGAPGSLQAPPRIASTQRPQTPRAIAKGQPTRALRNPEIVFARGYANNAPAVQQSGVKNGAPAASFQTKKLPGDLLAFDVGDLNGDGNPDLVASARNKIYHYRWSRGQLKLVSTIRGNKLDNYVSVDIADINGNGNPEVFITNIVTRASVDSGFDNELQSFVLEERGGKLQRIWRKVPLFFRVIKTPERPGGLLLAQRIGRELLFDGAIVEYAWNGKAYARNPAFVIPEGFEIYGFTYTDLNGDKTHEIVLMGNDGYLRIFTPSGDLLFETEERLGVNRYIKIEMNAPSGGPHAVDPLPTSGGLSPLHREREFFLKHRILIADIDGNGFPEVLTIQNLQGGGLTSRFTGGRSKGGNLVAYGWLGTSFGKLWETRRKKELYLLDIALFDPQGSGLDQALLLSFQHKFVGRGSSQLSLMNFY